MKAQSANGATCCCKAAAAEDSAPKHRFFPDFTAEASVFGAGRHMRKQILSAVALSLCQPVVVPFMPNSTRESFTPSVISLMASLNKPSYVGRSAAYSVVSGCASAGCPTLGSRLT